MRERGSAPPVEFRVLGEISMLVDGRPVPLGGARQRGVLAILIATRNQTITLDEIADRLWPNGSPVTAAKTIQVYVSRIRRALGPGAGRLATTASGYQLTAADDEVDSARFERQLHRARSARADGDDPAVIAILSSALALWHGRALADITDAAFARHEAARLEELRTQAAEALIGARLRSYGARDVIPDIRRWLIERPDREPLWGALMLALYQDGRQAEALGAYHEARRYLVDVLGIEPGVELRDLERQILQQDPSIGGVASEPGRIGPLPTDDAERQLVGRVALLAEIVDHMARHRLVTLLGPGGTGKTALLRAAVDALRREHDVIVVDASMLTSGDGLGVLLSIALELDEPDATLPAIAGRLGTSRRLLALDNLEQATGIGVPLAELLDLMPELHVLATSRVPTRAAGECEVHVPPLGLPDSARPNGVEAAPATALFLLRARAIGRLPAPLDETTASDVADLCRRLDGLPLAIELAAARLRIMSPREIGRRLDELGAAVVDRVHGTDRHRSLDAVLDWSLSLLSIEERAVLEACSVTAGSFDLDLVASLTGVDAPDAVIDRLVTHGLVSVVDAAVPSTRFRILETVRMVVTDRLGVAANGLRRRYAAVLAERVADADARLETRSYRDARAQLDEDLEGMVAAVGWAIDHAPGLAVRIIAGSITYRVLRGLTSSSMETLRVVASRVPGGSRERAMLAAAMARLGGVTGREAETRAYAVEAAESGRAFNMPDVEIEGLYALIVPSADLRLDDDVPDPAMVARLVGLDRAGPRQDAVAREVATVVARHATGEAGAVEVLTEGLVLAREARATRRIAYLAYNLAESLLVLDQPADACRSSRESATAAREIGDLRLEMLALWSFAVAASWFDDLDRARAAMRRATVLGVALATPMSIATCLQTTAMVAATGGRAIDAAWLLGAAAAAYAPARLPGFEDAGEVYARRWAAAIEGVREVELHVATLAGRAASQDEAIARALTALLDDMTVSATPVTLRVGDLSPPDVELLTLIGAGASDADVGATLGRSPVSVAGQVANLQFRLGLSDRAALARYAEGLGLETSRLG